MHLCRVESKLRDLKRLATPDRFQNFVWELNDFISSAKKVINYLKSEPGRGSAFRGSAFRRWLDKELAGFSSAPRNKAFLDLRNISDKDCAIVPLEEHRKVEVTTEIEWISPNVGELKDSKTGETIVRVHSRDQSGVREDLTVIKTQVKYFFEDWPTEDILTFLTHVVANLRNLVERTYDAFPNGFTLHKDSVVSADGPSAPK